MLETRSKYNNIEPKFLKITLSFDDGAVSSVRRLRLSPKTLFNIESEPALLEGETGEVLLGALLEMGAVYDNTISYPEGALIPAVEDFDMKTGRKIYEAYYDQGVIHDPAPGVPAVALFDDSTGYKRAHIHYKKGFQHNPEPQTPAFSQFMLFTDSAGTTIVDKVVEEHYDRGQLHDPAPGIPAKSCYDNFTGSFHFAESYCKGEKRKDFDETELRRLASRLDKFFTHRPQNISQVTPSL